MLGNRWIEVSRPTAGTRDLEGRVTASAWTPQPPVWGHLATNRVNSFADGQVVSVFETKALLNPDADVRLRDRLSDEDGEYTITSITPRRGPNGRVHHLSVLCERATR